MVAIVPTLGSITHAPEPETRRLPTPLARPVGRQSPVEMTRSTETGAVLMRSIWPPGFACVEGIATQNFPGAATTGCSIPARFVGYGIVPRIESGWTFRAVINGGSS